MMDLNKSGIEARIGDAVYAPFPARTFKLTKSLHASVGAGTICKLKDEDGNGVPVIEPIAGNADVPYCVIATNLRKDSFGAREEVKGWVADEVIWMESGASINAGDPVMGNVDGTVIKQTNTNAVLGIAESKVTGANQLVAVRLTAPYKVANEVVA